MSHELFRNMFLSFCVFGDFPVVFLLLISALIPLWSDNTLYVISTLLNLLRFVLWTKIGFILVYVPWGLEETVYSVVLGCAILELSIRSYWSMVLFSSFILLLIFCLASLSITEAWWSLYLYLLYFLSVVSVFTLHILYLCCLVHIHLALLCLLGGLTLLSLHNVPLYTWSFLLLSRLLYPIFI